jgi:hypothetical protein
VSHWARSAFKSVINDMMCIFCTICMTCLCFANPAPAASGTAKVVGMSSNVPSGLFTVHLDTTNASVGNSECANGHKGAFVINGGSPGGQAAIAIILSAQTYHGQVTVEGTHHCYPNTGEEEAGNVTSAP